MTLTGGELLIVFLMFIVATLLTSIPIAVVYYATKTVKEKFDSKVDEFELYRQHVKDFKKKGVKFFIRATFRDCGDDTVRKSVRYNSDDDDVFDRILDKASELGARAVDVDLCPHVPVQNININIKLEKHVRD